MPSDQAATNKPNAIQTRSCQFSHQLQLTSTFLVKILSSASLDFPGGNAASMYARGHMKLPTELYQGIVRALGDDNPTILTCALVSQDWLHESRDHFFSAPSRRRHIKLVVGRSHPASELTQDIVCTRNPYCTFWRYIRHLEVSDSWLFARSDTPRIVDQMAITSDNILSFFLPLAKSLRTLRLTGLRYSPATTHALSQLTSTSTKLSRLKIGNFRFTSPNQLCSFAQSISSVPRFIHLDSFTFDSEEWDVPSPYTALSSQTQRFTIRTSHWQVMVILKFILLHNWHITELHLGGDERNRDDTTLMQNVLRHVGSSLRKLRLVSMFFPFRPFQFDLKHNTSLEELDVHEISEQRITPTTDFYPINWLSSVLATISSRKRFKHLRGLIESEGDDEDIGGMEPIELLEWKGIEDVLLDRERFPGKGPTFSITLGYEADTDWDDCTTWLIDTMTTQCLPRLAQAGRLRLSLYDPRKCDVRSLSR